MSENFSRFLEPSNHPNYKWQKSLHQNWQSLISCPQLSLNLQPVAWATFSIFCVFWCNHSTTCYKNYLWKGKLFSILRIDTSTPRLPQMLLFFLFGLFFSWLGVIFGWVFSLKVHMTRTPVMRNLGSMELLFIKDPFTIHHRSLCSLIIGNQIS